MTGSAGAQFSWPADAWVAVAFNMAWETWPQDLGTASSVQQTNRRPLPESARYPRDMWAVYEHGYAETTGLQRLVSVFRKWEIPGTVFANGKTIELFPEIAKGLVADGLDMVAENWIHDYAPMMTAGQERESIGRTVDIFQQVLGAHPNGYVSPGGRSTPETYGFLAELGFKWVGGVRNTDLPYIIPVGESRLVGMNNYMLGDYESYSHTGWTPRQLIEMMEDELMALYEEGKHGAPKMVSYGVHPFLARGFRVRPFERFIDLVRSLPRVWVATRSEIADWVLTAFPELTFDRLYPEVAASSREWYDLPV